MPEDLSAEHVARKQFSVAFRGFDQHEVRAFLSQLAAELAAHEERERILRARISELESSPGVELDEAALERALGQEAMRVIHAAREAAAEIRANAEAALETARSEADSAMAARRADAEQRVASMLDEARAKAEALVSGASTERDRVFDDLEQRRREVVRELERLQLARDRLVEGYREVRRSLDSAISGAVDAAKIAGDLVASTAPVAGGEDPVVEPEPAPVVLATPAPLIPPTAPTVADEEPADDRRSSSLRLLRRREPGDDAGVPVEDDVESVRIIHPEPAAPVMDEPVAVEPVSESEPPAEEPDPGDDASPADAMAATEQDEPVGEPPPVDDLFARLRADRAEKVARAEAVLASAEPADEPVAVEEPAVDESVAAETVEPVAAASPDEQLLAARDESVAETERALAKSLKRALADEQNEVLDALRRLRGVPSVAALLPDSSVHDARYEAVLSGAATAAAVEGGRVGGGSAQDAGSVPAELGHWIASDLRLRVDRAIEESAGDVETLTEAISAAYRQWKTSRAEPLARDAIAASFATGLYMAADGPLRWVVDPAEGGCPDCDDNALAGATAKGTAFPTGQLHPPAHAGCRCVVVPA